MPNYEFTKAKLHKLTSGIAETPQDHLSIDLIKPYNTTTQGNTYTITAICSLTGYLKTTPIPNKKPTTVVVQLFSEIFLKFSFPRILHSDNGAEVKSKLIEHLAQQLGAKKTYISPAILSQMENHHIVSLRTA